MKSTLHLIEPLKGLAFPEVCQVCGTSRADAANGFTCRKCRSRVFFTAPPWCEQCGLPFGGAVGEAITCKNCYEAEWQFTSARSIMSARGLVREVVHRFKYNQHEFFEPLMIQWLQSCGTLFPDRPQCVAPVPLHPVKERERGFNQAERLATGVAKHLGLPMETTLLRRVKYTETQTNLTRKERLANMHNAFEASSRMPFSRILLVDDVMTTGSTASACAAALRGAGAARVDVLTLARGMPD
jgi:ComF family protein